MYNVDNHAPCDCLSSAFGLLPGLLQGDFLQQNRLKAPPRDAAKKDDDLRTSWEPGARMQPMLVHRKLGTADHGTSARHDRPSSHGQDTDTTQGPATLEGRPSAATGHVPLYYATSCPGSNPDAQLQDVVLLDTSRRSDSCAGVPDAHAALPLNLHRCISTLSKASLDTVNDTAIGSPGTHAQSIRAVHSVLC